MNKYPKRRKIAQKAAQKKIRRTVRLAYMDSLGVESSMGTCVGMGYAETKRLVDGMLGSLS